MATGLDFYERHEEHIGVCVSNPAVGADVAKALTAAFKRYEEYHGKPGADDSITVTADESGIFFEFRGATGITGAGGHERLPATGTRQAASSTTSSNATPISHLRWSGCDGSNGNCGSNSKQ